MSGRGAFGCSNRTESGKAFFLHFDRKRNDQQRRLALLHRIGCKKFVSSKNIRLYEDALENIFSTIKAKSPVPRAKEFKYTLRLVLAQFFKPSKHGCYDTDDSVHLTDFLSSRPDLRTELDDVKMPSMLEKLEPEEQESLEYVAGYIARNVGKKYGLCDICKGTLTETEAARAELLLQFKNYVANKQSLCTPSASVMFLIECTESHF
ncbi:hypothetical protein HPB51_016259 [Rhipicephalus microplus]|uniref:Uncharacterized protein n=1 Tax=Rhipicephalus microplus TaxID=6941 RepID=A0A9J6EI36_RHIMP|nr:hypothetical protein HPB51_016259 [Rhipicephalus microplus]